MLTQSVASLENIAVKISATVNGTVIDPTSDVVAFAFLAAGVTPVSGDYTAGSWYTDVNGAHYAKILIGTGGHALAVGRYHVWVKVTDSPEVPARDVDILAIT